MYVIEKNRLVMGVWPRRERPFQGMAYGSGSPVLPAAKIISEVERGYFITTGSSIFIAHPQILMPPTGLKIPLAMSHCCGVLVD